MLSSTERDLLIELKDCQGCINNKEYNSEDITILKALESKGLVQLCWILTPKGKHESVQ